MRRGLTWLVLSALLTFGGWNLAAGRGYERGKADATRALTPQGFVVVTAAGLCTVYDTPGVRLTLPDTVRAQTVLLLRPAL